VRSTTVLHTHVVLLYSYIPITLIGLCSTLHYHWPMLLPFHYLLSCICKYSSQLSHLLLCSSITGISISYSSVLLSDASIIVTLITLIVNYDHPHVTRLDYIHQISLPNYILLFTFMFKQLFCFLFIYNYYYYYSFVYKIVLLLISSTYI
jgi:hypothetical protein